MTNIVASIVVSIVTNISEQITTPPAMGAYGCLVYGCQTDHFKEAQDKAFAERTRQVYTECKEVTTLTFEWSGKREITSERSIWRNVQNYKMNNSWQPVGGPQPAMRLEVTTNGIVNGLTYNPNGIMVFTNEFGRLGIVLSNLSVFPK